MAKTANLNIRIDPETKAGAEQLFARFGITITDAVNIKMVEGHPAFLIDLYDGKGGAADWLFNSKALCNALGQHGFAGA